MPDPNPRAAEAMARAIYDACKPLQDPKWDEVTAAWLERRKAVTQANAALTALCALHPGVREVIEGSAVVVPREATEAMIEAGFDAADGWFEIDGDKGPWLRSDGFEAAYRAQLAASPYAQPAAATEGGS